MIRAHWEGREEGREKDEGGEDGGGEEKGGGGRVEEGRREGRVHPCTKQALLLSHLCVCVCVCV